MSRTLYLHLGQPKTGTTHLQSVFSANRQALASAGIDYPVYGDDAREIDLHQMVPCGNGRSVLASEERFSLALAAAPVTDRVFFSSELMFNQICESATIEWLPRRARDHGFAQVRTLCLLRDPISYAVSEWQQRVKGSQGEVRTLDDYLAHGFDGLARDSTVIERLARLAPYVEADFLRYETVVRSPGGLEGTLAKWLGVDASTFVRQPAAPVNRALTRSEAELQRQLNLQLGRSGHLFGFPVTVDVPDIARDAPRPGRLAVETATQRLSPDLVKVNAAMDSGHELVITPVSSSSDESIGADEQFVFGTRQLAVLATQVARHVGEVREGARPRTILTAKVRSRLGGLRRWRHRWRGRNARR